MKKNLNKLFALALSFYCYTTVTAMTSPMPLIKHFAIGILAYSPVLAEQCVNHGNAKGTGDTQKMHLANKILAASFAIPITVCTATPIIEAGIKKAFGKNPTRFSRNSFVSTGLIAGMIPLNKFIQRTSELN